MLEIVEIRRSPHKRVNWMGRLLKLSRKKGKEKMVVVYHMLYIVKRGSTGRAKRKERDESGEGDTNPSELAEIHKICYVSRAQGGGLSF